MNRIYPSELTEEDSLEHDLQELTENIRYFIYEMEVIKKFVTYFPRLQEILLKILSTIGRETTQEMEKELKDMDYITVKTNRSFNDGDLSTLYSSFSYLLRELDRLEHIFFSNALSLDGATFDEIKPSFKWIREIMYKINRRYVGDD